MENIKNNYQALLREYDMASQFYLETGLTRLLSHALHNLEQFERAFVECYSLEELGEMQIELNAQGLAIV